ncbi:hypothetical protein FQK07_04010 [Synechococcus sp. BSF8S]|uniref:hypothetical protein n=1 Tax=Synechococcales TaxID=1890424 RepID=UPI001624E524|nr:MULTISPECIES: hypothetical protein [unclassified Synechococcus]MBC1260442.1 hypothetical protein [Synechococcus sp. BSF8S]MBC1263813.1 hypothetical protein [Synechococcus sp. BSA11S]
MDNSSPRDQATPIVVSQGGNGTAIGLIVAAIILGGAAVWAVSIWSDTQLKMIQAPAEAIKEGIKGAAEAITPGQ